MSVLQLSLLIIAIFTFSALASFLLTLVRGRDQVPLVGGIVKIKTTRGVYRSKFCGCDSEGWHLTSPVGRSGFVTFREHDDVIVEMPILGAALLARTRVRRSDQDAGDLLLAKPHTARRIERREMRRVRGDSGVDILLEGQPATLIDLAALGARVECSAAVTSGDRVRLDLGDREDPLFGWVLEVLPAPNTFGRRTVCRLSFEERVEIRLPRAQTPLPTIHPL